MDAFAFRDRRKETRQSMCRACHKTYHAKYYDGSKARYLERQRSRRAELKAIIARAKDVPCADCGGQFPRFVLEFDHRDRRTKRFSIAAFWKVTADVEVVLAEIAKCDIVCANCHRVRTHRARAFMPLGSRLTAGQRPLKP